VWFLTPSISSRCAPEAAGSNSESNSSCHALERSVWWRSKPSLARYWRRRMKTWAWVLRLAGRMCAPSTAAPGVDAWIASLRDTRASRSAWRVEDVARMIRGTFGPTFAESLERSARRSCSSRTSQATFGSDCERSDATWNEWVTWLRRDCLRRRKSARRTNGNGCSSWPTPSTTDCNGNPSREKMLHRHARPRGAPKILREWAETLWLTPHGFANRDRFGKIGGAARDVRTPNLSETHATDQLANRSCRFSLPGPATSTPGGKSSESIPCLNPQSMVDSILSLWRRL